MEHHVLLPRLLLLELVCNAEGFPSLGVDAQAFPACTCTLLTTQQMM